MIIESISLLGHRGHDKITGAEGVITSVVFDLFGCVQVNLDAGIDKDGKQKEHRWYDIARIDISSEPPVMAVPAFDYVLRMQPAQ